MKLPPFEAGWPAFVSECTEIRSRPKYCQFGTSYQDDYEQLAKDLEDKRDRYASKIARLYEEWVTARITQRLKS